MRGFPLISLLIVVLFLGAAAVPLAVLSRDRPKPTPAVVADSKEEWRDTTVSVRLAHPASGASLWSKGKQLYEWKLQAGQRLCETKLPLPFSDGVMEFELHLTWPQDTPDTVAEVAVEPDGLDRRQQNVWGEGAADEVLHFRWEERP